MWTLVLWLALAVLYGVFVGYDHGLRKGRAEHSQCHQATRALSATVWASLTAMAKEANDLKAWENEL